MVGREEGMSNTRDRMVDSEGGWSDIVLAGGGNRSPSSDLRSN